MAASVSTQYWSSIPSVPLTKIWTCSRRWNFFQLLVFNPRDEYYLDHEIIIIITITAISVMPYEKLPQRCMQWRKKTTTVSKVFSMDLKSERERERERETDSDHEAKGTTERGIGVPSHGDTCRSTGTAYRWPAVDGWASEVCLAWRLTLSADTALLHSPPVVYDTCYFICQF